MAYRSFNTPTNLMLADTRFISRWDFYELISNDLYRASKSFTKRASCAAALRKLSSIGSTQFGETERFPTGVWIHLEHSYIATPLNHIRTSLEFFALHVEADDGVNDRQAVSDAKKALDESFEILRKIPTQIAKVFDRDLYPGFETYEAYAQYIATIDDLTNYGVYDQSSFERKHALVWDEAEE